MADPENFGGGGFEAQNLKNSDVFTKIESDFSAEIGNSNVFSPKFRWSPKKKKVFTKIESDFLAEIGNSNVFFVQIQVVSKKKNKKNVFFAQIQVVSKKKKNKRSSPKLRLIFRRVRYV